MPTDQHAQPPDDDRPPPPMDELDRICRQMLAETMRPCRELPLGERLAKRAEDRRQQRHLEEAAAEQAAAAQILRAV